MRKRRWLSDEKVREVHKEYVRGAQTKDLAQQLRCSSTGLVKAFRRLGLSTRSRNATQVQHSTSATPPAPEFIPSKPVPGHTRRVSAQEALAIYADRQKGMTYKALAAKYNRADTVIMRAVRRAERLADSKMGVAQRALAAANSAMDSREAVLKDVIGKLIESLGGMSIQELRVVLPEKKYEVTYTHTEEGRC